MIGGPSSSSRCSAFTVTRPSSPSRLNVSRDPTRTQIGRAAHVVAGVPGVMDEQRGRLGLVAQHSQELDDRGHLHLIVLGPAGALHPGERIENDARGRTARPVRHRSHPRSSSLTRALGASSSRPRMSSGSTPRPRHSMSSLRRSARRPLSSIRTTTAPAPAPPPDRTPAHPSRSTHRARASPSSSWSSTARRPRRAPGRRRDPQPATASGRDRAPRGAPPHRSASRQCRPSRGRPPPRPIDLAVPGAHRLRQPIAARPTDAPADAVRRRLGRRHKPTHPATLSAPAMLDAAAHDRSRLATFEGSLCGRAGPARDERRSRRPATARGRGADRRRETGATRSRRARGQRSGRAAHMRMTRSRSGGTAGTATTLKSNVCITMFAPRPRPPSRSPRPGRASLSGARARGRTRLRRGFSGHGRVRLFVLNTIAEHREAQDRDGQREAKCAKKPPQSGTAPRRRRFLAMCPVAHHRRPRSTSQRIRRLGTSPPGTPERHCCVPLDTGG